MVYYSDGWPTFPANQHCVPWVFWAGFSLSQIKKGCMMIHRSLLWHAIPTIRCIAVKGTRLSHHVTCITCTYSDLPNSSLSLKSISWWRVVMQYESVWIGKWPAERYLEVLPVPCHHCHHPHLSNLSAARQKGRKDAMLQDLEIRITGIIPIGLGKLASWILWKPQKFIPS